MSSTVYDIITAVALWGPLVAALAVAMQVAFQRSSKLKERMGLPAWDFSRSWASNISVVGGLVSLATFTGLLGQSQPKFIRAAGYAELDFVFPFIAALAPLVYNFSRTVQVKSNGGDATILSEGSVRMFIVAGVFTIWACTGQLLLQALWLMELGAAHTVPPGFGNGIAIIFLLVSTGMLVYASKTMIGTIDAQTDKSVSASRSKGVPLRAPAPALSHAETWPLL